MKTKRTTRIRNLSGNKEAGYLLLSVMLVITLMLIAMAIEAPRIAQQIKREKEEELVHRGKQYAVAIKKFYHKNGTYPVSLDQLENTNNQRFLRHRYKDPMTTTGEWKLIHVGEAQITIPAAGGPGGTQGPGQMGSVTTNFPGVQTSPGLTSPGGLTPGGLSSGGLSPGGLSPGGLSSGGLSGGSSPGGLFGSTPSGSPTGAGGGAQAGGQMGTLTTSNIGTGVGPGAQGGGPIIGVVSTSKNKGIKEFNGSDQYDHWLFVYDPRLEQGPGGGGITVASPTGGAPIAGAVPAGFPPAAPANPPAGSPTPQPGTATPAPQPAPSPTPQAIPQ